MSSEIPTLATHAAPTATPSANEAADGFLDPRALMAASAERRFTPQSWPLWLMALGLIVASSSLQGSAGQLAVLLALSVLWIGQGIVRRTVGRAIAAEIGAVTTLEELVQLRRWPEAANLAQQILSRPMFLRERRLAALVSLATLLARYHRFDDARVVQDYLLSGSDGFVPDPTTGHALRVARAIGMLREDHLVDADKAMSDLRREVNRARDEVRRERGTAAAAEVQSAGLALLELYRDIKTRHYEEACEVFDRSLSMLRQQLGMRVADAWVLIAAARDGLGQTDAAREAYANATTLAPALELHRRYPETQSLADRYAATTWPTNQESRSATKAGQA